MSHRTPASGKFPRRYGACWVIPGALLAMILVFLAFTYHFAGADPREEQREASGRPVAAKR